MTTPEPLPQSELERIKALCEQPYTGIQIYLSKCVAEVERLKFRFDQQSKTNTLLCEELTRLQTELAEARKDKERLRALIKMTDIEGQNGGWAVTLSYDNYQDTAKVLNADSETIGECGEIGIEPDEQFILAIDAAMKATPQ